MAKNIERAVLSFIIMIIVVGLGSFGSFAYFLRSATTHEANVETVNKLNISKITLGRIDSKLDDNITLDSYIAQRLNYLLIYDVSDENVSALLEEQFVKDFIVDKLDDYIFDLVNTNGKGKISADEIVDLLDSNWPIIKNDLGFSNGILDGIFEEQIKKEFLLNVKNELELTIDFDNVSLNKLRKAYEVPFMVAYYGLSYMTIYIIAGICLVLMLLQIIMNVKRHSGMEYVGLSFAIIGAFNIFTSWFSYSAPEKLDKLMPLGRDFYWALTSGFPKMPFIVGAAMVIFGIMVMCVGMIAKNNAKKKCVNEK